MQFQYSAEQLQLPSLCFLIAIFVASLIVFTKRGRNAASRRNIRGPWMLPIIGSLHHLIGSELPHRRLRTLALRYGPDLMLMRLGQVDNVVVSSQEAARDALGTHDLDFSSRPRTAALGVLTYGYTNVVFSPYGSHWRQLRKICVTELLTADREKSFFGSVRREEILNLVKEIGASGGRPVDLGRKLESLSYAISFRAMVGRKCGIRRGQEEEFFSIMKETGKVVFDATFSDLFPSFMRFLDVVSGANCRRKRLHGALDEALDEIVEEHEKALPSKNGEEEDLTDVLLRLKESDELDIPLTRENIKAVLA